jgi:hypothetical protein
MLFVNKPVQKSTGKWEWPRWNWRDAGLWFTISGTIISFLTYIVPSLPRRPLQTRLIIAGVTFVTSGLVFLLLAYLCRVLRVAWGRLQAYQELFDLAERRREEITWIEEKREREVTQFQEAIRDLLAMTGAKPFEIDRTQYYGDTLYIVLKKRRGIKLENKHKVSVFDLETYNIMGVFEVTEERDNKYWARNLGQINPVWLGYAREPGNNEAPPNTATFWMQGEIDGSE